MGRPPKHTLAVSNINVILYQMINGHRIVIIWEECVIKWQKHARNSLKISHHAVIIFAVIVTLGNSIQAMFCVTLVYSFANQKQ
jgi:formate/nitrite transporter FocA (FNT family)